MFTFGHVRQLDSVAASMLIELSERAPLLPAGEAIAFLDVDDTIRATYGYAKQGAGYGYSKVKGINALIATGEALTYVDIDDTIRSTFGYAKTEHHKT